MERRWLEASGESWSGRSSASVARLLAWATQQGTELRGVEVVELDQARGYGVRAVRPLAAGEKVICLPRRLHVNGARCHRDMPDLRKARAADFSTFILWLVHTMSNPEDPDATESELELASASASESGQSRGKGECTGGGTADATAAAPAKVMKSTVATSTTAVSGAPSSCNIPNAAMKIYTEALPGPLELGNAPYMTAEALAGYRARGEDYAKALDVVLSRVSASRRYIADLQSDYPSSLAGPAFKEERLRWAQAIVCSRGLSVNGTSMLLPVVDMLNHAPDGCLLRYNDAGDLLVMTTRAYEAGEEVCLCYGDKQGPELLANYGYDAVKGCS